MTKAEHEAINILFYTRCIIKVELEQSFIDCGLFIDMITLQDCIKLDFDIPDTDYTK